MSTSTVSVVGVAREIGIPLEEIAADLGTIHGEDEKLVWDLYKGTPERTLSAETGFSFANERLAGLAQVDYSSEKLAEIEGLLRREKATDLPIIRGHTVHVGGATRQLVLMGATEVAADGANHGDMSSMVWVRDQTQAASALMELSLRDPERYEADGKLGKELLLSTLHLMSTDAQLERFRRCTTLGKAAGQGDWPFICMRFDNLDSVEPNNWRNKQDAFQMLAHTTLDALERGFLRVDDLTDAHKEFLGSIVPFLRAVGFPRVPNSGSWEEIEANRTSVMAVETALLHKIARLTGTRGFDFLRESGQSVDDFSAQVNGMVRMGLEEIGRRLPDESPDYEADSVKFRKADAALVYVLSYGIPELLAAQHIPIKANGDQPMTAEAIEDVVLGQLATLLDPVTNGMARYLEDSYQRKNFHLKIPQLVIAAVKRKLQKEAAHERREIDLDEKQAIRGKLFPDGRPAAWTHPLGQVAAWAAQRSVALLQAGNYERALQYRDISTRFVNAALSTVTGEGQLNAVADEKGNYVCHEVTPYRLPECYVAYETANGEVFYVPSPHTPLNWSSAMLREAIGLLGIAIRSGDRVLVGV